MLLRPNSRRVVPLPLFENREIKWFEKEEEDGERKEAEGRRKDKLEGNGPIDLRLARQIIGNYTAHR